MKSIEELEKENDELKETIKDYEETVEIIKQERDDYKNGLEKVDYIVRKLV